MTVWYGGGACMVAQHTAWDGGQAQRMGWRPISAGSTDRPNIPALEPACKPSLSPSKPTTRSASARHHCMSCSCHPCRAALLSSPRPLLPYGPLAPAGCVFRSPLARPPQARAPTLLRCTACLDHQVAARFPMVAVRLHEGLAAGLAAGVASQELLVRAMPARVQTCSEPNGLGRGDCYSKRVCVGFSYFRERVQVCACTCVCACCVVGGRGRGREEERAQATLAWEKGGGVRHPAQTRRQGACMHVRAGMRHAVAPKGERRTGLWHNMLHQCHPAALGIGLHARPVRDGADCTM